jgi:hypothetical protein
LGYLTIQVIQVVCNASIGLSCYAGAPCDGRERYIVGEAQSKRSEARIRSLRWMEALWEGATTTAQEENRKEEVLWVCRELARDSEHENEVREYGPWEPCWR